MTDIPWGCVGRHPLVGCVVQVGSFQRSLCARVGVFLANSQVGFHTFDV